MSVRRIISKINDKINKLSNKNWLLICFAINILVIILLNIEIIFQPYIHAEDGSVFIPDVFTDGINSLGVTFGGHLYVISRLFAFIGVFFGKIFNSMVVCADVMKTLCILFIAFVSTYFCSDSFADYIKSRKVRLLCSDLLIMSIAGFCYMLYNSVSIHWWTGILALLCSLQFFNKKTPSYTILLFLLLSIVSSASSMILGFSIVYYIFSKLDIKHVIKSLKENFTKNDYIKLTTIIIFLAIQAYAILFMSEVSNKDAIIGNFSITNLIISVLKLTIHAGNYIFGIENAFALYQNNIHFITGAIVWIILFFVAVITKKKKIFLAIGFEIAALYTICIYKRNIVYGDGFDLLISSRDGRLWYNAPQSALIILLSIILIYSLFLLRKRWIPLLYGILVFMGMVYYENILHTDFSNCHYLNEIEKYVSFSSDKYVFVPISGYEVAVPVTDEYCKEHECNVEVKKPH